MKSLKYIFLLFALLIFQISCDDGFAELNIDPNAANEINPEFQFTLTQLETSGGRYENWRAGLIYSSTIIQHLATICDFWTGDKYTYNAGYASSLFDRAFVTQVREIQDLIFHMETDPDADQTMLEMAKIWRVVIFHRVTDMYGDIPYFEAGKGVLEGIDFPKYDSQADIYADMLSQLDQAILNLGQFGVGFGKADLIYGGNIDQWRRFGNSLMLRLGMRLSEVDSETARFWVQKAIAGGVMESNNDDAFIEHAEGPEGINQNGIGAVLDKANGFGDDCPRLSAAFIDWMVAHDDPRLDVIGDLPVNGGTHNGLPNGLDAVTILDNPTGTSVQDFDHVNPILVTVSSPMMFLTYAETEFLRAEAALKGWHGGDAKTHYEAGVRAAMKQYKHWDESLEITDAAIDEYLAKNPFDGTESQIGSQYWAATFLNEYEAYANWRRTGYPELTPVTHPTNVTGGTIPVRLVYPQGEAAVNPNFQEALDRQGMSSDFVSFFTVPVWWDK